MICRRCLLARSALRSTASTNRSFSSIRPLRAAETSGPPKATSTGLAQPFSNPLSPAPNDVSLGKALRPKAPSVPLPESICAAGTRMTGLNYLKGRDDPVALKEEEYPEWLWRCLDAKKEEDLGETLDEFSKSKKVRRKAAKRQRKLEEDRARRGEVFEAKIPLTQQSIDLPANEEGTPEGALEAEAARRDLTAALRRERRKGIKEANYLKTM